MGRVSVAPLPPRQIAGFNISWLACGGRLRRWSVSFNDPHKTALSLSLVSSPAQTLKPPPSPTLSPSPSPPLPLAVTPPPSGPAVVEKWAPTLYLSPSLLPCGCSSCSWSVVSLVSHGSDTHTHTYLLGLITPVLPCAASSLGHWNWRDSSTDCDMKLNYLSLKLRSSLKQPMGAVSTAALEPVQNFLPSLKLSGVSRLHFCPVNQNKIMLAHFIA